jgi:tetratricopeptide (TPR) repeat protein
MKIISRFLTFALLVLTGSVQMFAQCGTWNEAPNSDEIQEWHVIYRQFVKGKTAEDISKFDQENFNIAYNNWEKCYNAAPNADGQRPFHYIDGRKLLKAKAMRTDDKAAKEELYQKALATYDAEMACYPKKEGFLLGRQAFDRYQLFAYQQIGDPMVVFESLEKAVEVGGNDMEYILLEPLAYMTAYLFNAEKVEQPRAQAVLDQAFEIAEYNIENNKKYGEYYKSSLLRAENQLGETQDEIFDCQYFRKRLMPLYRENPDSLDLVKYVIAKLKSQGCDENADFMVELDTHFKELATEYNAKLEADRRANNPAYDASQLQKEGEYAKAVDRYMEAIEVVDNPESKAQFYYSIAFMQTWDLGQLSSARSNANKAASLRENWGKPYILMGDIYAKLGRINCDDWNSRLAILAAIDKYNYAKSIDSDVSDEASRRIANYRESMPLRQDGFMRKIDEGDVVTVGCGINERVRVRYQ